MARNSKLARENLQRATPRKALSGKAASVVPDADREHASPSENLVVRRTRAGKLVAPAAPPSVAAAAPPRAAVAAAVTALPVPPAPAVAAQPAERVVYVTTAAEARARRAAETRARIRASAAQLARRHYRIPVAIAAAGAVVLGAIATGFADGANATFVGMGFDPDRADLLVALIVCGTTAAVSCLASGWRVAAVPLGFIAACLLFGPTFVAETQGAMAATGAVGSFDPIGWILTAAAFVVFAALTAWASATVAVPLRLQIGLTAQSVVRAVMERPRNRHAYARPVAAALVLVLIAVTLPVAGDMFNFGADSHILAGGPPRLGLVPDNGAAPGAGGGQGVVVVPTDPATSPTAPPARSAAPSSSLGPGQTAGPTSAPLPTPDPTLTLAPWENSRPSGESKVVYVAFPAPWASAEGKTEEVAVYLPPGYDTSGDKRYPTFYEAPFTFWLWNAGIHIQKTLDTLILDRTIPPSIFVFANAGGEGPYADSECADSLDGLEKMDRFLSSTVPVYVDKHYRTFAQPGARTTFGMSEGGYCAASLLARHPDVFGAAIPFSGYFAAGAATAASKLPFGNDPNAIAKYSPSFVIPGLSMTVRQSLYFVLISQPGQVLYGQQADNFAVALDNAGVPYDRLLAVQPHGWPQVRDELAEALRLVADWQARNGLFN